MQAFIKLSSIAAPMRISNVDTDMIIPKQFLKTVKRGGLGVSLFHELRTNEDGTDNPNFILNKPPYNNAEILIAKENFGCGSSREHAPWALLDFGIRCVIAPSFADIFHNNCFKNGILPIALPKDQVELLMTQAEEFPNSPITVDLDKQTIQASNHPAIEFDVEEFRKYCLLNGLDDIGLTLKKSSAIKMFEEQDRIKRSWIYSS